MTIAEIYKQFTHPVVYCDIHEHLPQLREIAASYPDGAEILELGTREGKSTSAFLSETRCALAGNNAR